jgi:hypothetical protein
MWNGAQGCYNKVASLAFFTLAANLPQRYNALFKYFVLVPAMFVISS